METGFSIYNRNPGHWDISNKKERLFRLRGGPSGYLVLDERSSPELPKHPREPVKFNTLPAAMAYICDILMFELIIVDGQKPEKIASWNL